MNIGETVYLSARDDWREWLQAHHESKSEIWLIYYRKHTGQPTLSYRAAVEEALCFDWIDSIRKGIDEDRYAQRFTPRNPNSAYSQTNKERLAQLAAEGKLMPKVRRILSENRPEEYEIPQDILSELRSNTAAWNFFQRTSPSYQRIRAAYVDAGRRRPGEFERRLNNLIEKSAQEKQFGYHIENFY